ISAKSAPATSIWCRRPSPAALHRPRRFMTLPKPRSSRRRVRTSKFRQLSNTEAIMKQGSNFWVIGGEFGSMNFHKLVEGSAQVRGPFKTRKEAEDCWREVSEENRNRGSVRVSIVE